MAEQVLLLAECERIEPPGLDRFTFRLSRGEFRQLHDAAAAKGVSPSELVRDRLYAAGVLVLTAGSVEPQSLEDEDESDEEIELKFQVALRAGRARPGD